MHLWVLLGALGVGVLGGALGIGGGLFLVPLLVFVADVRPIEAVGISLFCIIGSSVGSSSVALRTGDANLGLSLLLEPGLVLGAVVSSVAAQRITDGALLLSFSIVVVLIALAFLVQGLRNKTSTPPVSAGAARFFDGTSAGAPYRVRHAGWIAGVTPIAGVASGLFGIGGGVVTVPLVSMLGGVPLRATAATTSLSLMVTAGAAGAVHVAHGTVPFAVAAVSMIGVIPGGLMGARLQRFLPERALKIAFAILALLVAASTANKALS
jgi:uncharacterized protein